MNPYLILLFPLGAIILWWLIVSVGAGMAEKEFKQFEE